MEKRTDEWHMFEHQSKKVKQGYNDCIYFAAF